jgi:hypothetical protein
MPSAIAINNKTYFISLLGLLLYQLTFAQENIPWSRYGIGDPIHSVNIINRGMGYVSAAYNDPQSINFTNPASYSRLGKQRATLDLGIDFVSRGISNEKDKARFSNVYVPYLAGGFQLKGEKRKRNWGIAFGLRPLTKVSYNIETGSKIGEDSIIYTYEGNGGAYQAFAGTGIAFKNLSVGVNVGYRFGSKDYTTKASIFNDTISGRYTSGQKQVRNNFGGVFYELGLQYEINISANELISLGAFGGLSTPMSLRSEENLFTFFQPGDASSAVQIDSVSSKVDNNGTLLYPSHMGFGIMYDRVAKSRLSIGADVTFQNWGEYRINKQPDLLSNAWQIKAGVQWMPNAQPNAGKAKTLLIYRAGTFYSKEPFSLNGNFNSLGFTLGLSMPVKKYSYAEYNKNNVIHLALEAGRRGNASSIIIENYFRVVLGVSFSDIWFIKSKYD